MRCLLAATPQVLPDEHRAAVADAVGADVMRCLLAATPQVLPDEHRAAVSDAVGAHHDQLLPAARRRREDLARHLRAPRLHRLPPHDRRHHPAHVARHPAHGSVFAHPVMTFYIETCTCSAAKKPTAVNWRAVFVTDAMA